VNTIPHKTYAEPFAGGLAVLFAKTPPIIEDYAEAINDIDERIYNVYRVCQTHKSKLLHLLQHTPHSQAMHAHARHIQNNPDKYTSTWRAWATIIQIRLSFANKMGGGWGVGTNDSKKARMWANYLNMLPMIMERFKYVYIACEDALRFIERWDTEHTIFYCDPPYPGADQGHYKGYTLDDHRNLCRVLDGIKGSYILSNYPQEVEPLTAQQRIEIQASVSAALKSNNTISTEVLWVCNRSSERFYQKNF
jgi:DNA adenine methylase